MVKEYHRSLSERVQISTQHVYFFTFKQSYCRQIVTGPSENSILN